MARSDGTAGGKGRRCTIYDVARLAEVSAGTVSHVLNGSAPIAPQTRRRVTEAIRQLGYTRNENARALRTSSSRAIGIALRDIASEYYARCAAAILQRAQAEGYAVLTLDAHYSSEVLRGGVAALVNRRVDGLIFVGGGQDRESFSLADAAGVPIVFGDRFEPDYPCVQFDNRATMSRLVRTLYRQGYRTFWYYGEALSCQQNLGERFGGFMDAALALGVPEAGRVVLLEEAMEGDKMRRAFETFRRRFRDGEGGSGRRVMLTSNDMIAQGVIAAALRAGVDVPGELAVFGFDDISIAACATPSISTVSQDPRLLGEACFDMLLRRMRDPGAPAENVMLPQSVVIRESAALDAEIAREEGLEVGAE